MPTNVTPEYKAAKAAFQQATDPAEKVACLKEMLRVVPKHKGTDHLCAELKTRLKQVTEEAAVAKKKGGRVGPATTVRAEGAAQVSLLGPPNSGKSCLHAKLTKSHAEVAPYPRTTHLPLPGMLPHEDIHFQLVDLPPMSASYMEPWMPNAVQPASAALLVVDLTAPDCVDDVMAIRERLNEKRITLEDDWGGYLPQGNLPVDLDLQTAVPEKTGKGDDEEDEEEDLEDLFGKQLPTLIVANKKDLDWDPSEIDVLEELLGIRYPAVAVSAETGDGLDRIGPLLFHGLGVVRVYSKPAGKPPDMSRPFTLFRGSTVLDVARQVHKDFAKSFKFARVWGSGKFDGQQVGRDHVVSDKDVVELHV